MTKINKLVMHGFKSFAKRTELVFGNDFNCIIGPNGSGKSNVLDAMCFVLGKSSVKGLRAEKSANLIYNGGKTKKPAKQAEVSIYFDNTSNIFPTDDKEVKITRLVKKNGQGVYKINDKTRTRAQIIELLSLAKIDPDGYNIVLQGDINKIIDMTPVERRQIIEEISGISIYEDKKQKAIRELDKVEGKLKEAEIILIERETYLKELKKERDQARKFKNLQDRLNSNKATSFHRQITQKRAEKEELDERSAKHKEKIDVASKEVESIKKEIAEFKSKIENINQEIEQKGEKDQLDLHKEIEKLKINVATSKNRIETCKDEIAKIKNRKENLNVNIKDIDGKLKELNSEKYDIAKNVDSKKKEGTLINKKIDEFKKKHKLDQISDFEKDIDEFDGKAETLQIDIQKLRQQQQEYFRENDKFEFQIQAVDEKIEKVLELEKENKEQIQQLKQKKQEFKKATLELNQLLDTNSRNAAEMGAYRQQLIESQEELSKLRARSMHIQEKLGANMAVKKILELKNKFKGVYGTISELGEVSSKHNLALEVAAGNKIKGIVVESDSTAAECIRYLKKNRLGVATFFPLNKIRSRPENPNISRCLKLPGVHGRAVDLISFDIKFKKVFDFVFNNTLVVDNIEVARKIGIGTVKMTTLDGDTAEVSGAMQGGFRQRSEGMGFGEKEVNTKIKQLEKVNSDLGMKLSKLEKANINSEENISKLREFKAHLEADIIKIEKVLHLDSDDLDANKKLKKEYKQK
ncbi:AAA family ATPase, partial [Candidatus Woesearchaeota archaeon]|nr:AAA family ATPase [Candidatus Woesearchaeota archaeon]